MGNKERKLISKQFREGRDFFFKHTQRVCQPRPVNTQLFPRERHAELRGITQDHVTAELDVPTTITFAGGRLWTVNARFSTAPGPDVEYWITQVPPR